MNVEELAATSGESVRTIRFYQSEGVLPPPVRQGREVRYDDEHVRRLRLISELQRRGLRLAAIRELLDRVPDPSADDWAGLSETLAGPWSEDHPLLLDEVGLRERLGDLGGEAGAVEMLVAGEVVERRGDTMPVVYVVPSPGLLDVAVAIHRLGVPPEAAVRLRDLLQWRLRDMATELVAEFTDLVSLARLEKGGPDDLADLLSQLRPLTRRTIDLLFVHEMERAQRELLEEIGQ